jgi:hypothetical protein
VNRIPAKPKTNVALVLIEVAVGALNNCVLVIVFHVAHAFDNFSPTRRTDVTRGKRPRAQIDALAVLPTTTVFANYHKTVFFLRAAVTINPFFCNHRSKGVAGDRYALK